MNEEQFDEKFKQLADAFIDLANQQSEQAHVDNVGMAFLYAASRFNAYVFASAAKDLEQFEADMDSATGFFEDKYKEMLLLNLNEYKRLHQPVFKYTHLRQDKVTD